MGARVDTSRWNLFGAGAWSAGIAVAAMACGPAVGSPQGETDDPTGETDPSDPTTPSGTDPTQGECVQNSDCPYGYDCVDNFCEYNCYCGCGVQPPPGHELRCSEVGPWYECYSDSECGEDEVCQYGNCLPEPDECASLPIEATSVELAFSQPGVPVAHMQFADVLPDLGAELYVARGNTLELATSSGEIAPSITTAANIVTFAIGDVDGDGMVDLVTAEDGDAAALRFWQGSDFGFSATQIAQPMIGVRALFIADRDGDGDGDVYAHVDRDLVVLATDAGLPLATSELLLEERVDAALVFDAGSDGVAEVLFADGGLSFFAEQNSPQSQSVYQSEAPVLGPIVGGDFDLDGEPDAVAFAGVFEQITLVGEVPIRGTLVEPAAPLTAATTGDVDGDGRSDLVILEPEIGSVRVRYGMSSQIPEPVAVPLHCDTSYSIATIGQRIAAGDVDGDLRAEIAVGDGNGVVLVRF